MKHRLQTLLKHKLQWLVLLTALLGVSQGILGHDISADIFVVNSGNWAGVNLRITKDNTNYDYGMTHISGTGIYVTSQRWNGYWGFRFFYGSNFDADWKQTGVSSKTWFNTTDGNVSGSTTLSELNGTAKVVSMVSNDGGSYTKTASSNCQATVSSVNLGSGNWSTDATSGTTGSSNSEVSCYPAYGATITYTATASGKYEFKGFSSTSSTSLPSNLKSSGHTETAMELGSEHTKYYAYFATKEYTATANVIGGSSGGGRASVGSPVYYGATATFTATPDDCYTFTGWYSDSGGITLVSTSNPYQITNVTANKTLYAKFTNNAVQVNIDANLNPSEGAYTGCPGGKTLTIAASGGTSPLTYQWYRNTSKSTSGGIAVTEKYTEAQDGNIYTPPVSDAGTNYYYYCIVRSSGVCEPYKSATSNTSDRINLNSSSLVLSPASKHVKSYEPVTITATNANVESWSLSPTEGATQYLYDSSKRRAKFKGVGDSPAITYTITATARDGLFTCPGKAMVIVEEDDDCE